MIKANTAASDNLGFKHAQTFKEQTFLLLLGLTYK